MIDDDAIEQERVADAVTRERLARDREIADLLAVLASVEGRRFAYRLLSLAGVYRTSFVGDAAGTAFNEGARSLGLRLLSEITDHGGEALILMLREAQRRQANGEA